MFIFASGIAVIIASALPSIKSIEPILQGIGGSLVATGVAGIALFLYVKETEDIRQRLQLISDAGLQRVFPVRSVQIKGEYDERLLDAKEIDILGFGMASLREDYGDEFPAWSHRARVRILLLDPSFPTNKQSYADQRDIEEHNQPGKIRNDVALFLKFVAEKRGIDRSRFEVRLLRCLPSVNIFRAGDNLFWGPYLLGAPSRNTPTLLVGSGFLQRRLREHFDDLWRSGEFSCPAFPLPPIK